MKTSLLLTAKWTSAPLGKLKQRLGVLALRLRVAVEAVLVDRVLDALGEVGLQLDRRDRQAVEEEDQVERILVGLRIVNLPHDAQAVGGVAGEDVGVHRQRRLELGQRERLPQADDVDAVAQHFERAAIVELLADAVEQDALRRRAVRLGQRLPGLGLRRFDPGDEIRREEGAGAVVGRGGSRLRRASRERRDERISRLRR